MKLIRYNYPEFTDLFSDFDRLFQSSFGNFPRRSQFSRLGEVGNLLSGEPRLAADLYQDEENYYARVELPGVKKDEIKVELDKSVLTLTYERKAEEGEERESVAYKRSLTVPEGVEEDKVSASLKDGILTVTLPRERKEQPKEIAID